MDSNQVRLIILFFKKKFPIVFTGFYRVLLGFIGFYWVFTGFYLALLGYCWVWLGLARLLYIVSMGFCWFWLALVGFHMVFPSCYRVLLSFVRLLLGFTVFVFFWCLARWYQVSIGFCRLISGFCWVRLASTWFFPSFYRVGTVGFRCGSTGLRHGLQADRKAVPGPPGHSTVPSLWKISFLFFFLRLLFFSFIRWFLFVCVCFFFQSIKPIRPITPPPMDRRRPTWCSRSMVSAANRIRPNRFDRHPTIVSRNSPRHRFDGFDGFDSIGF